MLSVYVDDFKMAGRTKNSKKAWDSVRAAGIQLDEPIPFAHYPGCNQHKTKMTRAEAEKRLTNIADNLPTPSAGVNPGKGEIEHDIKAIAYDMQGFIDQCVER